MISHNKKSVLYIKGILTFSIACIFIVFVGGCPSPDVWGVDSIGLTNVRTPAPPGLTTYTICPDFWRYQGQGGISTNTYLCGFKWINQLKDIDGVDYNVPNIDYSVQLINTRSFYGYTNLWDVQAPIGQPFGWVSLWPEEYDRDEVEEIVRGRTTADGNSMIAVMLGGPREAAWNPDVPANAMWQWPNLGGTIIDTVVELTVTVDKRHGVFVTNNFWAWFYRAQWQGFCGSDGGIYSNSWQGVGDFPYDYYTAKEKILEDMKTKMPDTVAEAFFNGNIDEVTAKLMPKDRQINYPIANPSAKRKIIPKKYSALSGSIDEGSFQQLRWEYVEPNGWGWYYFDIPQDGKIYQVWCDPNDPNKILALLNGAEPYSWRALVTPPETFNGKSGKFTVYFRAVDSDGDYDPAKDLPITAYVTGVYGNQLEVRSEWWLPSAEPELHGLYYDANDNPVIFLYMPEGTHAVLVLPEYGDFNNDENIDIDDIALFVNYWLGFSGPTDESNYDGLYDDPNNIDGSIDFFDFASFSKNWKVEF